VLALLLIVPLAAAAPPRRVLEVGAGKAYPTLSAAAAAQRDGDHIRIAPGYYPDCAVLRANDLLVEGAGMDETVIGDSPCLGKGLFVTLGARITIRNLTLARAAVPDQNGAGIRAEGPDLTVEGVQFEDNENGILAHPHPTSRILIRGSRFLRNGQCKAYCAHGIYINAVAHLLVENSVFREQNTGHHIKSRALATEVIGNEIDDGAEGTASYQVDLPHGGRVLIAGNRMRKGPRTDNPEVAIMIGAEGTAHPETSILVRDNFFRNDGPKPTVFVENRTPAEAVLRGNRLEGEVVALRTVVRPGK